MSGREYVEYGANRVATAAGPSQATLRTLSCFFLEADREAIDRYVERVLCGFSDGAVTYRAVTHHVMVSFGSMTGGRSLTEPYTEMGRLDERQLGFWLFLARVHRRTKVPRVDVADRFVTFVPYMLVDNPLSLTIGREVNGFAKSWGTFETPAPNSWVVGTYGGNFGAGETAGPRQLCSMIPAGPAARSHDDFDSLVDLIDWLDPELSLPALGLDAADDLWDLFRRGISWGVFLRQLRATADNTKTAYAEIAENPIDVSDLQAKLLPHAYDFTLEQLDSCPVGEELGIESQRVPFGVEFTMGLELGLGETIWTSTPTP